MLATPASQLPPDSDRYTAEVKWGGMRAIAAAGAGRVMLWSRTGRDVTAAYPELSALAAAAGQRTLLLDGEIVALSGAVPDFARLQRRMHAGRPLAPLLAAVPVTLIVAPPRCSRLRAARAARGSCSSGRARPTRPAAAPRTG
jgi:bifunctional non-homologous end joining protein LigD